MATVASQLTRIHDLEGTLTLSSIGGGAGASANTDIFLQNSQSAGRRQSNVTLGGFWLDDGGNNDLSAAGTHMGMWVWHTHYGVLTALQVWLGTSTANYDQHAVPLTEYPNLGGWHRVWIHVGRTPDATGGTGLTESQARWFGLVQSLPTVGGTSQNLIMDAIDSATAGLLLTGTSGLWSDFVTSDENATNRYGVLISRAGVLYCLARLTLGSASSLAFDDSGFVIVFPDQSLVASTFMGVTVDLQHASTSVAWANGVIRSAGTRQGDLVVTGTSGVFSASNMTLRNLRTIDLTSACTLSASNVSSCDKLNQSGATISGCTFSGATTADGEAFVISNNPAAISDCSFTFSDGHAIEITATGTYTFTGNTFTGYGANGTNDAAIYNNSGGLVTLNISGGSTPTVRNGASASTTINNNVNVTLTGLRDNTEVRVYTAGTTTELAGIEDATAGSADNRTFTFSLAADTVVDIRIHKVTYETFAIYGYTVPSAAASIPISQRFDRNYANP
ncbi:hypothetical protein Rctr197k_179 [Virus Rctr197k]|nr:hypothetical protein Rctr197k_179 [Virus Rctr197k]